MKNHLQRLLDRLPELAPLERALEEAVAALERTFRDNGKILVCGNGGSAADAEHIVGELMKGFLLRRPLPEKLSRKLIENGCSPELCAMLQEGIPAISLVSGVALPTAFANDVAWEAGFAQQVLALGRPGDVLVSLSTSGNSKNVIAAMRVARATGLINIGLTGTRDCAMRSLADVLIAAPSAHTPEIQEFHLAIYHALCAELEARLFGEGAREA